MNNVVTQLPEELGNVLDSIEHKYLSSGFLYGWKSATEDYDYGHWNKVVLDNSSYFPYDHASMPYLKNHPDIELLWNVLKLNLGDKQLLRVYFNGYTYGTDAYAHQDENWLNESFGPGSSAETVLVYLNKTWDKNWAGETVVFNNEGEIEFSVLPKYLRAISFDAIKFHAARPLSRHCPDLRKVLIFKTLSKKANHPAVEFLLNITNNQKHSGKTFFEHLYNTMRLLEKNKTGRDVSSAGLFHSIYGTEFYNFSSTKVTREKIKSLIGDYAESLAYEFCILKDRTDVLLKNTNNYNIEFRNDLLKIEAANLQEQNTNGQYNQLLKQILTAIGLDVK